MPPESGFLSYGRHLVNGGGIAGVTEVRLALGTVQFGMPYGVANTAGQIGPEAGRAILRYARRAGIDTLDTARSYGDSERSLGVIGVEGWRVISKLPGVPGRCDDAQGWVRREAKESLEDLKVKSLAGLLLHRPSDLLEEYGKSIWAGLAGLKEEGLVEKIGFSIYAPSDLDLLWPTFRPDMVQAPYNICDRRLDTSGWLQRMHAAGVEVHVRSVFLQGLLLMDQASRPLKFSRWFWLWDGLEHWLQERQLSPLEACLSFALADERISRVVVGVDSLQHLREIMAASSVRVERVPEVFSTEDLDLINPTHWNSL